MALEGQQLGHYRLLRLLGSGGMGEVYLAEDARIGQQVAIKVIHSEGIAYPQSESAKEAARLFEREVKAIARLDHPNILPLYAYGEETLHGLQLTYMVMPYRKDGTLAYWLRQRDNAEPLSPAEVAPLLHQAADALQHAHNQQVIHQDIKPTNFLIRVRDNQAERPDLLLADFGIAKLTSATASASQSARGTPTYMAPEQWDGQPVPATDQYALAIMVYELLVGHPPFQGGPGQVMRQHYLTPPPTPSTLKPHLSAAIDAVLLRALAKAADERFASVAAFAQAFQQAVQTMPTVQSPSVADTRLAAAGTDAPAPPSLTTPAFYESGLSPPTQATQPSTSPTEGATPADPTLLPRQSAHSSTQPPAEGRLEAVGAAKPAKRGISLRIALIGLAGLVVVALASGIAWFTLHPAGVNTKYPILLHPAGVITEFPIQTSGDFKPVGITAGSDGKLWFTEASANQIGRISTSGRITEFPIPTAHSDPEGITAGADGKLWFTESAASQIGRISTSGRSTEFPIPTANSFPVGITAGADGNLWFTESDASQIGRISTSGRITEFPIPTAKSNPQEITAGADGKLWFTEANANQIGCISTSGRITEFPIPTANNVPQGITAGADGNLWFTDTGSNQIGRITSGKLL